MDKEIQYTLNQVVSDLLQEDDKMSLADKSTWIALKNNPKMLSNTADSGARGVRWGAQSSEANTPQTVGTAIIGATNAVADGSYRNDPDYVPPKSTMITHAKNAIPTVNSASAAPANPGMMDQVANWWGDLSSYEKAGLGLGVPLALAGSYYAYNKLKNKNKQQ